MANNQKIDEIIDPKAFQDWERFVESLSKGQSEMAKVVSEANRLNKEIGSSSEVKEFSKAANAAAISLEKLKQEQAKTTIIQEKANQSALKTIDMANKKIKAQEKENLAKQKAQQIAEKADKAAEESAKKKEAVAKKAEEARLREIKRTEEAAKKEKENSEQSSNIIVQNENDIKRGLEAAAAAAVSSSKTTVESTKKTSNAVEKLNYDFEQYGISIEGSIGRLMQLKAELNSTKKNFKELGDAATPAQIVEYERDIKLLNESMRQVNVDIRRFTRYNLEAEDSTDQLEAKLNILRGEYNKLSKEEKETSEEAKKLLKVIQELDEAWKEQKRSVGQTNVDVGDYQRALEHLPRPMGEVVGLLQSISQEQGKITFKGIIAGLKDITRAAIAFIMTPIGMTLTALSAILAGGKMWYDYNVQLEKATKLTKDLTDLTGDDLKAFRSEVQATADTFGDDFNEVLRTSNTLAKEFNISYQESIDLINQGYVSGANSSGQMLDNIKEYSSQLSTAGMTAQEMVGFLVRSEKEGIFNDKAVDTIKEGTLRLREMTKATKEALAGIGLSGDEIQKQLVSGTKTSYQVIQEISEKVQQFSSDSSAMGAVLADVFGGPGEDAGVRFLSLLQNINGEQELSVENMTDLEKATYMQLKASEDLNKEMASLFDATGGGFELMKAQIMSIATQALIDLIKGLKNTYNWFAELYNASEMFRGIIQSIPLAFRLVWNSGKALFDFLINNMKLFGNTMKAILTGDFASIPDILEKGGERNAEIGAEWGRSLADALVKSFNNTAFGRIDLIGDSLNTTDALTKKQGNGKTGTNRKGIDAVDQKALDKAARDAEKARQKELKQIEDFEKRKVELSVLSLNKQKANLEDISAASKKVYEDETNTFNDRFNSLTDYYNDRKAIIDKQAEIETEQLKKQRIEAKTLLADGKKDEYNALLMIISESEEKIKETVVRETIALREEVKKETTAIVREQYGEENKITREALEQNITLRKQAQRSLFNQGKINERQYQDAINEIEKEGSKELIDNEIQQVEEIIRLAKEKGVNILEYEKELAKLRIALSNQVYDNEADNLEKNKKKQKDFFKDLKDIYQDIQSAAFQLFDAIFERKIQDIEKDIETNDEQRQMELDAVESSTLSDEQKRMKQFAINQKYDQKEQELERKKIEMQRKQAKFQKAQAIMNIALFTAQGIARAFADYVFPFSAGIAAAVGVLGAVQMAAVLAQPLPQYYKGTKSSEGGPAHVGERGSELFVTPDGTLGITPASDTIMNLEQGTRIFTANETKKILEGGQPTGESYLIKRALKEVSLSNKELIDAYKNSKIHTTLITKKGWSKQVKKATDFNKYLKDNGIQ